MRFYVVLFSVLCWAGLNSCKNDGNNKPAPNMEEKKLVVNEDALEPKPIEVGQNMIERPTLILLSADSFDHYLKLRTNTPLIDLRPAKMYNNAHIYRAVNIPFDPNDFDKKISHLKGLSEVAVYSLNGTENELADKYFKDLGINLVFHLDKGVVGWAAARKTMVDGKLSKKIN